MEQTFEETGLENITIPECVKEIGYNAFRMCTNLKNITIIGNNISDVRGDAFYGTKLHETFKSPYIIINGVIANINDSSYEKLMIPNNVFIVGTQGFANVGIKEIMIPAPVKDINNGAFCTYKTEKRKISLSNSIESIGVNAFYNNYFENLIIPGSVKQISYGAFRIRDDVSEYTNLILLNGVEIIAQYAFNGVKIKELFIPKSVKEIGSSAFNLAEKVHIHKATKYQKDRRYESGNTFGAKTEIIVYA